VRKTPEEFLETFFPVFHVKFFRNSPVRGRDGHPVPPTANVHSHRHLFDHRRMPPLLSSGLLPSGVSSTNRATCGIIPEYAIGRQKKDGGGNSEPSQSG
jgi:hypothetical protein